MSLGDDELDERRRAATECPRCHQRVLPVPDSDSVVAWYACPTCDHEWSARLRAGRPVEHDGKEPSGTDDG